MQCFINATHSRTHDYHILGRTYSNMGTLCHLAEEYPLSYDMYERCAEMFLRNGDSLLYYYGLNNMAFELAEQGKKEESLSLLAKIQTACTNNGVIIKILETKAEIYIKAGQPDSAACCIKQLNLLGYKEPAGMLIMAQSFSRMGIRDSAIWYANCVLSDTNSSFQNRFNALYLLSHNDTTLNQDEIRVIASEREDIRYYEYEPLKEQLTNAVQLLEQDLNRKLDWRKLLVLIMVIFFGVIGMISVQIWHKRKHIMEKRLTVLTNTYAERIITSIKNHIDVNDLNSTLHWKDYAAMKLDADLYMGGIVSKLETYKLNEVEIRFCILSLLDLKLKQIADTIHYSYPSGIKTLKKRISDKLGTTPPNLKEYVFKIITNTPLQETRAKM